MTPRAPLRRAPAREGLRDVADATHRRRQEQSIEAEPQHAEQPGHPGQPKRDQIEREQRLAEDGRRSARPPPDDLDGDRQHAQPAQKGHQPCHVDGETQAGHETDDGPAEQQEAGDEAHAPKPEAWQGIAFDRRGAVGWSDGAAPPPNENSRLTAVRTTRTAMKASSKVSTIRRSKGGHSNARNEPVLAKANVDSAAVSERTACPGSAAASGRRNRAKARRMSHSAPKPTAIRIARIPITRPGLPEFTSRETTPAAFDSSCGMRGMASASAARRARTAASQFEICVGKRRGRRLLGGRGDFSLEPGLHFRVRQEIQELPGLLRRQLGGSSLRERCPDRNPKDEQCDATTARQVEQAARCSSSAPS